MWGSGLAYVCLEWNAVTMLAHIPNPVKSSIQTSLQETLQNVQFFMFDQLEALGLCLLKEPMYKAKTPEFCSLYQNVLFELETI